MQVINVAIKISFVELYLRSLVFTTVEYIFNMRFLT